MRSEQRNVFFKLFITGLLLILPVSCAYSFDFSKDVASRFFWTKSYKEKHKSPTNNMPKTIEEYQQQANKAARQAKDIPSPKFQKDEKVIDLYDPVLSLVKYNSPPGNVNINLTTLKKKRQINSIGVASPKQDKLVYSTIYYYPSTRTVGTELYMMDLDTTKSLYKRIQDAHINNPKRIIHRTGLDALDLDVQKTLTVVDWSEDGTKIALKEKILYEPEGLWKTNLLIYDLETNKVRNLTEVREAIQYYWRENHNLFLKDYRWDIYPVGWDALNPDRVVVFGYVATGEKPKFLGTWSIDINGERAMLISSDDTNVDVTQNGICLRAKYD